MAIRYNARIPRSRVPGCDLLNLSKRLKGKGKFVPALPPRRSHGLAEKECGMKFKVLFAFVLAVASSLAAQTFRGTILGTVTDASGAVVPGAKVSVKNLATGLERTSEASADGSYTLPELPIGTYSVTVTQSGFQTSITSNVVVDVATERRVDVVLKTGQVSTTVEVSGELLPQVETTSAELGGVLTTQAIENFAGHG